MADKKPVMRMREPGRDFDVFEPDEAIVETFVDGVVGTTISPTVVKMVFYSVSRVVDEQGKSVEKRTINHKIVMPITSWVEYCSNTFKMLVAQQDDISKNFDTVKASVLKDIVGKPETQSD